MKNLEAAFHHAGHAVAAHLSRYHAIAVPLYIDAYGGGEVVAALSRRKLVAAEKVASLSARSDPEVATSIAVILCAGLASEKIAAKKSVPLIPDPERSAGDFDTARAELRFAGITEDMQLFEGMAMALLTAHWSDVQRLASILLAVGRLMPEDIAKSAWPDTGVSGP